MEYPVLDQRTIPCVLLAQAEDRPDATFLASMETSLTYREIADRTEEKAGWLASLGVSRGSHVLICMGNSIDMLIAIFAVVRAGGVGVLVNPELSQELFAHVLQDSRPDIVIADSDRVAILSAALDLVSDAETGEIRGFTTVLDDAAPGRIAWATLPTSFGPHGDRTALDGAHFSDPALIMYTSGTTGRPKGVVLSHAHAVTLGLALIEPMGLSEDDRFLVFMPLFHAMATCTSVLGAALVGGSAAVTQKFSASRFWSEVTDLDVTIFCAPATALEILMLPEPSEAERAHRVRAAYSVPLPRDPFEFEERFGIPVASGYAMTETPPIANGAVREAYGDPRRAGRVRSEFVQVRIADPHDRELPEGSVGEILIRPTEPFVGAASYLHAADATAQAHRNLWFHTGDLGRLDGDVLYYEGRRKDAIRRRGELVSPSEIESTLQRCPLVTEVAALPVPSELGEDDIALAVVSAGKSASTAVRITEFANEHLPRFMRPRYIALFDVLPVTASGKVQKGQLAESIRDGKMRVWDCENSAWALNDGSTGPGPGEAPEANGPVTRR